MHRNESKVRHLFLLTRPYSWVCSMAVTVAAWLLAGGTAKVPGILIPLLLSCLLWVGLNWLSESIQRDIGRTPPPILLVALVIVLSLGTAASQSAAACGWTALHYFFVLLYAKKSRCAQIGAISYLCRGGTVFAMCAAASAAVTSAWIPHGEVLWFGLALSLAHAARNLVGDIRDSHTDRYELPATHGLRVAGMVAIGCLLAAGLSAMMLSTLRNDTLLFITALGLGIVWLMEYGKAYGYDIAGRHLHHVMVAAFSCFTLYCTGKLGLPWPLVLCGFGAMIVLHMTYFATPGKPYRFHNVSNH